MLMAMVALACLGSFAILDGAELICLVSTAFVTTTVRYFDLRRYRNRSLSDVLSTRLEQRFMLFCLIIGACYAVWAFLVINRSATMAATVLMATALQAFVAIPFLAASYKSYLLSTLPVILTGLWLQASNTMDGSAPLAGMMAISYLLALRILFVHRRALFSTMAETARRQALDRQQGVMMSNDLVAIAISDEARVCSMNQRFARLLQLPATEGDLSVAQLAKGFGLRADYATRVMNRAVARARRHGVVRLNLVYRHDAQEPLWLKLEARLSDPASTESRLLWLVTDDTANKKARDELRFMAQHDALTGLANRHLFASRLRQALTRFEHNVSAGVPSFIQPQLAIISIDLDGFKAINDLHGHAVGDQLLVIIAKRLSNALRSRDTVARFGGDEFMVLLNQVEHRAQASQITAKLSDLLSASIEFDDLELQVGASIGLAMAPEDGTLIDGLLHHADTQMYAVKHAARQTRRSFMLRDKLDLSSN